MVRVIFGIARVIAGLVGTGWLIGGIAGFWRLASIMPGSPRSRRLCLPSSASASRTERLFASREKREAPARQMISNCSTTTSLVI
jgi:hypothetical protein